MKYLFCFLCIVMAGCSLKVTTDTAPTTQQELQTYGPDKWGVVCYKNNTGHLSCVQVTEHQQ